MAVVLARVDDRLVHGQVMEAWVPYLSADALLVVDGLICRDEARCRLMACIVPRGMEFAVLPPEAVPRFLEERRDQRIILLFAGLGEALDALRAGLSLPSLNIGNIHHVGPMVSPCIYLDEEDVGLVEKLHGLGIAVEGRDVPENRGLDLFRWVESRKSRRG